MAAGYRAAFNLNRRESPRDDVYYRTRGTDDAGMSFGLQIVNISATGFMARTEATLVPGSWMTLRLPVVGQIRADVRWALGGRVGCQFDRMIDLAPYLDLLGALVRDAR